MVKHGVSAAGVPLADGRFCAKCRRRQADPADRPLTAGARVEVTKGNLAGLTGVFVGWVQYRISGDRMLRNSNEARVQVGPAEFVVRSWDLRRVVRT